MQSTDGRYGIDNELEKMGNIVLRRHVTNLPMKLLSKTQWRVIENL